MPDFVSTALSIILSIGIFWYIYDARRKDRQRRAQHSLHSIKAKPFFTSSYKSGENPFDNVLPITLEELEDLKDLEAEGWVIGNTVHGNPFTSKPSMRLQRQTMMPIKPCYRRTPPPPQRP